MAVDTSSNTSITVEPSKEEKHKSDRDQTLGVLLFFGSYFFIIAILVLL